MLKRPLKAIEPIAKLICPLKSPFWGHLSSLSLPNPPGVGFVEVNRASSLALLNDLKIIDFSGQSSFAIGSILKIILGSLFAIL